ncbi:class I lanthipeptide [Pedobacter sp. KLB.chiD]
MKKQLKTKLILNKETVAKLNEEQMKLVAEVRLPALIPQ